MKNIPYNLFLQPTHSTHPLEVLSTLIPKQRSYHFWKIMVSKPWSAFLLQSLSLEMHAFFLPSYEMNFIALDLFL
jgi:hypothetical protein